MKKTIDLLKKEREKQKISLSEIASITKISSSTLKAIEECDLAKLPPKPYLRGFVRAYARCLNLDSKKILSRFDSEMGSSKHEPKKNIESPTKGNSLSIFKMIYKNILKYKLNSTTLKVLIVVATLVLVLVFIFLKQMFDKYSKEASAPAISPTITSVLGTDDIDDDTLNEDEGISIDVSDTTIPTTTTTITTTTTTMPTTTTAIANIERTVEIVALDGLEISYSVNGAESVNRTLQTGERVSITGSNIELVTNNAGITSISIDGESIGSPAGDWGEPFNFNIGN